MRLLYLSADYGIPVLGNKGGSVHIRELVKAFHDLGHEVTTLTPRTGEEGANQLHGFLREVRPSFIEQSILGQLKERRGGSSGETALVKEIRSVLMNRRICDRIEALHEAEPFDFIYERFSLWNFSGLEASKTFRIPYVLEINAPLTIEQETYRSLHLKSLAQSIEAVLFREADALITVSGALKEYIIRKGTPPDRIKVLPNAVETDKFTRGTNTDGLAIRRMYEIPEEKLVVGFIGSLKRWHGIEILIETMKLLWGISPDFHLLVVGNGPLRGLIEKSVSEAGFNRRVTITGEVHHVDIPSYIQCMDITVAPYLEMEEFYFSPLKIFEYMAAGKPIVASRLGQIQEIMKDGESCLLCRPGDYEDLANKILFLRANPGFGRKIGNRAVDAVRKHGDWKKNAKTIIGIVENICPETSRKTVTPGLPTS